MLWGLAAFGLASLGCALAPTTAVLVAFRVLQGVGAALLLPGTLAVITHAYPEPGARARAIGVWAGIGSAALPAGPVLGGALVQGLGWRAVFFINLPIVIVGGLLAARVVGESTERQPRRADLPGMLLAAGLLAAITFAFIEAGHGGLGAPVLVAALAAAALIAGFAWRERRAPDPMLDLGLFRRADFSVSNAIAATMNLATLGLLFVLTLFLQRVQGRSALDAGVALLPLFAPLGLLAPIAGRLTAQTGPRRPIVAGLACSAAGMALLVLAGVRSSYLVLLPALLAWGTGLGVLTPAVVAAAVGAVDSARAGLASAVNNTARQAGGAIGIAAFGALAGTPGQPRFVHEFHTVALLGAGLYVLALVGGARRVGPMAASSERANRAVAG